MPKVSKFICDGANGARCESEVNDTNGFIVDTASLTTLKISRMEFDKLKFDSDSNFILYFCSEGCLLKYLTQAIRELK